MMKGVYSRMNSGHAPSPLAATAATRSGADLLSLESSATMKGPENGGNGYVCSGVTLSRRNVIPPTTEQAFTGTQITRLSSDYQAAFLSLPL